MDLITQLSGFAEKLSVLFFTIPNVFRAASIATYAGMGLPRPYVKPSYSTEPPCYVIRMPGGVGEGRLRGPSLSRFDPSRRVIMMEL